MKTPETQKPVATSPDSSHLRMSGENARIIITNCHAVMRRRFRGTQLWGMVAQITGHGSGYSADICKTAGLDPMQPCGAKRLRNYVP